MENALPTTRQGNPRWVNRPEGSIWGDFGPDDHSVRLNLLAVQKVHEGLADVPGPEDIRDAGSDSSHGHTTSRAGALGMGSLADHPIQSRVVMVDFAEQLGKTGRSRFLLAAAPLNMPDAAGSSLTPIATT